MSRRPANMPHLSGKELLILERLSHERDLYGLQLVSMSQGRLKRGTVYVTLGRMETKGYVTSRLIDAPPETGGLPRRLYRATSYGLRVLEAWSQVARYLRVEPAR